MKKQEISDVLEKLEDIHMYSSTKLDYNSTTYINKRLVDIQSTLRKEYDRLNSDKIDLNCPQLLVLQTKDVTNGKPLIEYANEVMSNLVSEGKKIIDYGLWNRDTTDICVYIKYTT